MTHPSDDHSQPAQDPSPPPAGAPNDAPEPQDVPPSGPSTHGWRPDGPPTHPSGQPLNQPPPPHQPPYGGVPYGGQYGAPPPPGPPSDPYGQPSVYGGYPQYGPPGYYSAQGITAHDDTTWAMMGYLGQVVIGIIAPLIVYLSRKDRSPFVRFHGAQALNLALTGLIAGFGGTILAIVIGIVTMGIALVILVPAIFAFSITQLVFMVIASIRANRQEMYQIPTWICWPMVK